MTTIKDAIGDLFDRREGALDDAMDRHFAPDFRQRTNGLWDDRAAFAARIARLRQQLDRVTVTVLEEFAQGQRYAERHIVELVGRDGSRRVQEVFVFAKRDHDGRFSRIEEATLTIGP